MLECPFYNIHLSRAVFIFYDVLPEESKLFILGSFKVVLDKLTLFTIMLFSSLLVTESWLAVRSIIQAKGPYRK